MDQQSFLSALVFLHMLALDAGLCWLSCLGPWPSLVLGAAILVACLCRPESAPVVDLSSCLRGWAAKAFLLDYFPLIPYLGWFLIGAVLGGWLLS